MLHYLLSPNWYLAGNELKLLFPFPHTGNAGQWLLTPHIRVAIFSYRNFRQILPPPLLSSAVVSPFLQDGRHVFKMVVIVVFRRWPSSSLSQDAVDSSCCRDTFTLLCSCGHYGYCRDVIIRLPLLLPLLWRHHFKITVIFFLEVVEGISSACLHLPGSTKTLVVKKRRQIVPRSLWLAQRTSLSQLRQLLSGFESHHGFF